MKSEGRKLGPPPDEARLREAAMAHLARFGTTEAGLAQVLARRIDRWVRAAQADGIEPDLIATARAAARAAIPGIIAGLRMIGALNDAAFAQSRAKRLARQGKSRRATLAHLSGKGIDPDVAGEAAAENPTRDLAAACAYLRRRRLPPFGTGEPVRAMAALARGGFDREIAARALALDAEEADALILDLRRGDVE